MDIKEIFNRICNSDVYKHRTRQLICLPKPFEFQYNNTQYLVFIVVMSNPKAPDTNPSYAIYSIDDSTVIDPDSVLYTELVAELPQLILPERYQLPEIETTTSGNIKERLPFPTVKPKQKSPHAKEIIEDIQLDPSVKMTHTPVEAFLIEQYYSGRLTLEELMAFNKDIPDEVNKMVNRLSEKANKRLREEMGISYDTENPALSYRLSKYKKGLYARLGYQWYSFEDIYPGRELDIDAPAIGE